MKQKRADGTIAPFGFTDAREFWVDDTRAYQLGERLTIDGKPFEVTLINHKDGFIGAATPKERT